MRKAISKVPFVFFLLILLPTQFAYPQEKVKNIVMLFSLSSSLPSYQNILEGFKSIILENPNEYTNLIIEYLDSGRSDDEEYLKHIIDIYNNKYKDTEIDLLVIWGPGLTSQLIKYGLNILKTAPVMDIDLDMPGRITTEDFLFKNRLEIVVQFKTGKTLETAFALFPDNKNVFVISGTSNLDQFYTSSIEKSKKEFEPDHVFNFISGISMDSTIKFVRSIPTNSIIIVPSFSSVLKINSYSTSEVLTFIANNSKAPVFPVTDSFIKSGAGIGGYILSYTFLGKEAGRIASEILEGKQLKDISVNENSFYQNMYDWKELKRWDLLHSKVIPKNSVFYNEEITFFAEHKRAILTILLVLISETILIFYLIKLNRRQKEMTEQMLETESMYRDLIRNDRLAKMAEFAASFSHELNQPLTAILYNAQAGKRFLQSDRLDSKQAEEIFKNIIEDSKRGGGIISSIKNLMKLEAREKENVNLNSLINDTVVIIRNELIKQRIKINIKSDPGPVYVYGDKIQLQQVLLNFIKNGINALKGIPPDNRILEIIMQKANGSVTVSVRDSGPGFDDVIKEKLFKSFFSTNKNGFGIGLALCRSIIEKHKGEILAENIPGSGAQFSFRLKVSENE